MLFSMFVFMSTAVEGRAQMLMFMFMFMFTGAAGGAVVHAGLLWEVLPQGQVRGTACVPSE